MRTGVSPILGNRKIWKMKWSTAINKVTYMMGLEMVYNPKNSTGKFWETMGFGSILFLDKPIWIYIYMVSLHLCLFFKGGLCILFRFFWIRLRILFGFLLFCCPCCSPSLLFYFFAFLFFGFFALLLCFSASPVFSFPTFLFFLLFCCSCFSLFCFSALSAFCFSCFCASVPFYVYLFFLFLILSCLYPKWNPRWNPKTP